MFRPRDRTNAVIGSDEANRDPTRGCGMDGFVAARLAVTIARDGGTLMQSKAREPPR
jgi:hypothetical protein